MKDPYAEGWEASMRDKDGTRMSRLANPYRSFSDDWQAWNLGYDHGCEEDADLDAQNSYSDLLRRIGELDQERKDEIAIMLNEGTL